MKRVYVAAVASLIIVSIVIMNAGILFLCISCDGSCGSSGHGGMLDWVCPEFYFPRSSSISMIVVGVIGVIISIVLLLRKINKEEK